MVQTPEGKSIMVPKYYHQAWHSLRDIHAGQPPNFYIYHRDLGPKLICDLLDAEKQYYIVTKVVLKDLQDCKSTAL